MSFRRSATRRQSNDGVAMVATLMVVLILGVLGTIVLTTHFGSTPTTTGPSLPPAQTTTIPSSPGSAALTAAVSACEADFALVTSAIANYQALNGVDPPTGRAWATSTSRSGPFLQSWPSDAQYFSLSWNGSSLSVVPIKGRASHGSFGVRSPASGCFAI